MRLERVMSRAVLVGTTERVMNAARLMRDRGVSSVLVVDETRRLVGILTERDLTQKIVAEGLPPEGLAVGDFMTPNPVTASPGDQLWEGARRMAERGVRHLPVVQGDRPVGLVSFRDLAGVDVEPSSVQTLIAGREESCREHTVEVPAGVGSGDLGEILPAWL